MTDLRTPLQSALGAAYTIERELGGGGMSRVFVATETALGRRVVIKVVPIEGGAAAVERFRREISTAAQLQHPHIVPVLSAGEADGLPWFSMPFVSGESLRARLSTHGALPIVEATHVLRDVAQALAYAHAQGFVHRDIKPDNVLLADGSAMVTDFGVAKALSSATGAAAGTMLTAAGMALGTPAYMAPEQISADPNMDHRVDIYAWGCLAYELLTRTTPFGHRAPSAVYAAHLTETPSPVALKRLDVPPALAAIVMQCLAKDPAERPASARDLVAVLEGVVTPSAITAPTTGRARTRIRQLTIFSVILLGSVGGWFALRGRSAAAIPTPELDRSVVVLPFDNASRDTTQEYFADGLTDEITGRLAQVGLRVTGRNTAYSFKGKHPTPQEAGRVAGVATVLTGTVRRLGDRVRVSAELARASDNAVLWTFASERAVPEIVALQRDMVDSIATRLAVTARVGQVAEAVIDPRAYDLVLRARFATNQLTREGIERALVLFDSALTLQPRLVDALIGKEVALGNLADAYVSPRKVVPTMDSLLRVVMSIDSTRPDVLGHAAVLNAGWLANWALARRFAADVRLREPYNTAALFALYQTHLADADFPGAKALLDTLHIADPANPLVTLNRFLTRAFFNDSIGARLAWDLVPESLRQTEYGDVIAAYLPLVRGDNVETIRVASTHEQTLGHPSAIIAVALARQGRKAEAIAQFRRAERAWEHAYSPPELIAWMAAAVDDTAGMYRWLETGQREQSAWRLFNGMWGNEIGRHRGEPRYQALLRRDGMTELPPSR
jgi:TolB-like protein